MGHIEWHSGSAEVYQEAFLYDLENDPHERNNLIDDPAHRTTRKTLKKALLARMETIGEEPCRIIPANESHASSPAR